MSTDFPKWFNDEVNASVEQRELVLLNKSLYSISKKDFELLTWHENSLYGCCTKEGIKELHNAIDEVMQRGKLLVERFTEFNCFSNITQCVSEPDDQLPF